MDLRRNWPRPTLGNLHAILAFLALAVGSFTRCFIGGGSGALGEMDAFLGLICPGCEGR